MLAPWMRAPISPDGHRAATGVMQRCSTPFRLGVSRQASDAIPGEAGQIDNQRAPDLLGQILPHPLQPCEETARLRTFLPSLGRTELFQQFLLAGREAGRGLDLDLD